MDSTKLRILAATCKAVRQYGLDGVRIQNISELAGLSPGALYRYFESKDELLAACFVHVDRQVAKVFDRVEFDPKEVRDDPASAVRRLWLPYFRFWTARPDETVFYHRFRDSARFHLFDKQRQVDYFDSYIMMHDTFLKEFPRLREIDCPLLSIHLLTMTVLYAKYVVEGVLPNNEETERWVFQIIMSGLSDFLRVPDPA